MNISSELKGLLSFAVLMGAGDNIVRLAPNVVLSAARDCGISTRGLISCALSDKNLDDKGRDILAQYAEQWCGKDGQQNLFKEVKK
jgi:hypothetical protein